MNNILSKIIKHASENVPFYRELYSKTKLILVFRTIKLKI